MILTIDGPAGAGKSTVARRVARALRLPYLNSGYIYRAVTLLMMERGGDFGDRDLVEEVVRGLDLRFVEEPEGGAADDPPLLRVLCAGRDVTSRLKDHDVTSQVHRIANDGGYRALLVDFQRAFAEPDGVVAEGRDMGTVIFPGAGYKFYLDASVEERARRQHEENLAHGRESDYEDLLAKIRARDERDRTREHAPLRMAQGAIVIDTSLLSVNEVVGQVLARMAVDAPGPSGRILERDSG